MTADHRDFDTVLVANRGEIAFRVFRTIRAMGLRTVAVYSEADADMPHVRAADRAVCIGPAPASESYLNIERIIDAARRSGAQAIHPGYGFLSESDAFALACEQAGFVFIGPSPDAIRAMGNKATAKQIMLRQGVPCIPGYDGADQGDAAMAREAARIGFPVMIKAVAGGGGKGMRLVSSRDELADGIRGARNEALKAFGNGALMLEKALVSPRHVEVQVFGDHAGNVVYLGDRDCSIQRRHQKVIEEAPAPDLPPELRIRMGEASVRAAKAVNYVGAGTVEFLVTSDWQFYFLEMNTRLQVEHPVTEMVTGIDLVEWQLRVARGESLPLRQEQIRIEGHAIEARVYAEDPSTGFLPQTGRISIWKPPQEDHIRVDSGLDRGARVTTFYDPMVAKVVAHGPDRDTARRRLAASLERFPIGGLRNNLHFLRQSLLHPVFARAEIDTGFLDRENINVSAYDGPELGIAAIAAVLCQSRSSTAVSSLLRNWRSRPWPAERITLECEDQSIALRVGGCAATAYTVEGKEKSIRVQLREQTDTEVRASLDGVDHTVHIAWVDNGLDLVRDGLFFRFIEVRETSKHQVTAGMALVTSPMPGNIMELRVSPGVHVAAGEVMLILEAMKMEHKIQAPRAGRVAQVHVEVGQQVGVRQALVHIAGAEHA